MNAPTLRAANRQAFYKTEVVAMGEFVEARLLAPSTFSCALMPFVKNRPIGNLPQWDDLLSNLEAAFWSRFIVDDGRNELQKSGGSNSRKQVVQLSSRSISAGNLVFSS